jgi:hypothetical protein
MKSRREMRGRVRAPSSDVDEPIRFPTLFPFSLQFPTLVEPAEVRTAGSQGATEGSTATARTVPTRVFPKLVLSQAPHDAKPEQTRQGQRQSKGLRCPERQRFGRGPGGREWIDIVNTVTRMAGHRSRFPWLLSSRAVQTRRAAHHGTHNDEWVLAVGGERRHARRGLAARIVAGDSQDSRRERREAAKGSNLEGPRGAGGEGITRKEPQGTSTGKGR